MQRNLYLWLLCVIALTTTAQENSSTSLNLSDPAPPLRVREWLKGAPVERFQKGQVYVLELWATWCHPCIAAMPHLSALASQYKDKVTFIGIDVMEKTTTPMKKIKDFVDKMGKRMDYLVAAEAGNFVVADWMEASGERGIPKTFVVDREGRLAWIGHPMKLEEVLRSIVNNSWDTKKALATRKENKRLKELDYEASYTLMAYIPGQFKPGYLGNPDSILITIDQMVKKEPQLKYAPYIADYTFSALLKTNSHKAYEYGKAVLVNSSYEEPACDVIISRIEQYIKNKESLSEEIYQLGANAYQTSIGQIVFPELTNISEYYDGMAAMYGWAKNKSKAIETQQKAIEMLKNKKDFSAEVMTEFENRLQQYKNL